MYISTYGQTLTGLNLLQNNFHTTKLFVIVSKLDDFLNYNYVCSYILLHDELVASYFTLHSTARLASKRKEASKSTSSKKDKLTKKQGNNHVNIVVTECDNCSLLKPFQVREAE